MEPLNFGELVKRIRLERHWSRAELAERSGVDRMTIWQLEQRHADPKISTAIALLAALQVSAAVLDPLLIMASTSLKMPGVSLEDLHLDPEPAPARNGQTKPDTRKSGRAKMPQDSKKKPGQRGKRDH